MPRPLAPRIRRPAIACVTTLVALTSVAAHAQVPGGGPPKTDCYVEWSGVTPNKGKNVVCQDGDSACDVDGTQNGVCVFGVGVCAAQTNVAQCTPAPIEKLTVKARPKAVRVGGVRSAIALPLPPPTPITSPTCSADSIIQLPLKQQRNGKLKPSPTVTLTATAIASAKPKRDTDVIKLRCIPNTGGGSCAANPAGGPRELRLLAAASGTDLDNGWSGNGQNFPIVSNSELRVCLTGCGATANPECSEDEVQTPVVNGTTFGAPLPLFTAGTPVCVVNGFTGSKITGFTADISSGVMAGSVELLSGIFLTDASQVCPRCSGAAAGQVGTCTGGARAGKACTTTGVVTVANATGNRTYALSPDCQPSGTPSGTIRIGLPLTTGVSTLDGAPPCPGQTQLTSTGCGECGTVCTGAACASTIEGQCVDAKGGVSQNCCTQNTATPCFPVPILRTGVAAAATPPFPDPTYPKSGNVTLAATFCEASTGSAVIDIIAGLPGPGALLLPMAATWLP
jgi:hypothetical protein